LGTTGQVNTGRYKQIGKIVLFALQFRFGAGMSGGIGQYRMSLPVPASANAVSFVLPVGTVEMYDDSASTPYIGSARLTNSTTVILSIHGTLGLTGTVPVTLTAGDWIFVQGSYEAA
jgi:hypothetical protein